MIVELHILQNFAPSCLNRDDTNSPKDCEFGSFRRARISSQCIKRAIRQHFKEGAVLGRENLADRSKRLVGKVAKRVAENHGKDQEMAGKLVSAAIGSVKLTTDEDGKTQYLLFLAEQEIDGLAGLVGKHWDDLLPLASPPATEPLDTAKRKTAKQQKAAAKEAVPAEIVKAVEALFDGGKAADLALFGRMLADLPEKNIDAACQVAQAFSTNRVAMEMDYYTAVDDLKPDDTTGADMIGTVEFNSACFYRYANINLRQLKTNLQDDVELARKTVEAFLRASIEAVPTGKQNSMAAQNPPDFMLAVVRKSGFWSLANAFVKPVRPDDGGDLVENSVRALARYWGKLTGGFGRNALLATPYWTTVDVELANLNSSRQDSIDHLIQTVSSKLDFAEQGGKQ